ncbi:MAG: methyl-accepting chemotaxis protein [Deltaproteobacteria bacterium]|jgi:methyl-accepting chemotaxis protein|nr:methyl-accepting chemotaxis protein [Deltaproteobacteria bacterium]
MSFKAKIAAVVGLFVVVALCIGIAGTLSLRTQEKTLIVTFNSAESLSNLKSMAFGMEEVAAKTRDIIIINEVDDKKRIQQEINRIIAEEIEPLINAYTPTPESQGSWDSLVGTWHEYTGLLKQVMDYSMVNSGYYARVMSSGASFQYWMGYEQPIRKLINMARTLNHPRADELAFQLQTCLEAIKGLQLQEKLAVSAVDAQTRDQAFGVGSEELRRVTAALNTIEGIVTNPAVKPDQFKDFTDHFNRASKNKIKFEEEGKVSWEPTQFTLPPFFVHPELKEISTYYWNAVKPMRGGGTEIYNKVMQLTKEDSNNKAYIILDQQCRPLISRLVATIYDMVEISENDMHAARDRALSSIRVALVFMYIITGVGILVGIIFATFFTTKLNHSLQFVASELGNISVRIDAASVQLASSSNSLAQGASENATSLADTRHTLEGLSKIITDNTEHTREADQVIQETASNAEHAEQAMRQLSTAMEDIAASGMEIEKILKVIDEIAFQTNLLALNAAVEAARAGEAGAGFAVVAGEVRNLAVRSAEAAKNTANLINQTIHNIESGSGLVKTTASQFSEMVGRITRAAEIFSTVAKASKEQAQNVSLLNTAVLEMDAVTQNNASAAQETSEAATGLTEQVHILNKDMDHLLALANGDRAVTKIPMAQGEE